MEVMQYEITLPADYDKEIIRRLVATRGHADPEPAGTLYEVLHLSAPHLDDIEAGRHC